MTVGELKKRIGDLPDEMLVGAEDSNGVTCEIQFAGVVSDDWSGIQHLLIRANGGYRLFAARDDAEGKN